LSEPEPALYNYWSPTLCFSFGGKKFGMQTVRVPVGRVPRNKNTHVRGANMKNACDNVDFRRTNEMNPKLKKHKYLTNS
jgi:hypothetical protein